MIDKAPLAEILAGLDPAYVATDDVGVITAMSRRAEDLLGVNAGDAIGAHIAQAIPAGNIEGLPILSGDNSLLARCLATGEPWSTTLRGVDIPIDGENHPRSLR